MTQAVLEQIMAYAKSLGGADRPLTAQRFLTAVLDLVDAVYAVDGANVQALAEMVAQLHIDTVALKKTLAEHIQNDEKTAFFDGLYMQKILLQANDIAKKENVELTATIVLRCLLNEPDETLRKQMADAAINKAEVPSVGMFNGVLPEDILAALRKAVEPSADAPVEAEQQTAQTPVTEAPKIPVVEEEDDISQLSAFTKDLQKQLSEVIFGQDNAIGTFVSGFFQSEMLRMTDDKRVRPATFLFAGPPGVGKTFLAEQAAQLLGRPFKRFDMSEYSGHEAVVEFLGSDDVYRNAKSGNVTSFVKENPRCVLLFDEIEKAHYNIITLFLQLLDAGRLRDAKSDEEISFKDTIVIFTTNAGKQLYENGDTTDFSGLSKKVILRALQTDVDPRTKEPFFPAAICSRFASGNVVMFNHITANNLVGIAKREMYRHAANFEKKFNIKVDIEDTVFAALLFAEGGAADARTIRGRAEGFFNTEMHELFRLLPADAAKEIQTVKIGVKLPTDNQQIEVLFTPVAKPMALAFVNKETGALFADCDACDFVVTDDPVEAAQVMRDKDVAFVLVDILCGATENANGYLNIEDVDANGRTFLQYVHSHFNSTPAFLVAGERTYTAEERVSFARNGIRGEVPLNVAKEQLFARIEAICESIHQQNSMNLLAKANKVAAFSTSQTLDATTAHIHLFDFKLMVAVDAEDSQNILSNISKPNVKFNEVIGAEDAKKELQYFIKYLKEPKKFAGAQPPKGVILYGPPGTGKTMLAKAMASESDVTFISATGSQFIRQYIGQGGDAIRDLFRTARKYAPSILFIDEIDAIAQERVGGSGGTREVEATLTALLTEMDGFRKDTTKPVFVLAATNFDVEPGSKKSLDAALMRRFDRRIFVDLPTREERMRYLQLRTCDNPAYQLTTAKYDSIAIRSTGMSLAFLESILELALRMAIRDGDGTVTDEIFDEAFETYNNGERKEWDISTLERVARHEAGHAFLYWHYGETPAYLTVVARGDHGGYMQHGDTEKKQLRTKEDLLSDIRTSLGGRAAEIVYYGEQDGLSTGAYGDLCAATQKAQNLLCCFGMDDTFGMAVTDPSGAMAAQVREVVNGILAEQLQNAIDLITENKEKIDALVEVLMAKNHMSGDEIDAVLRG